MVDLVTAAEFACGVNKNAETFLDPGLNRIPCGFKPVMFGDDAQFADAVNVDLVVCVACGCDPGVVVADADNVVNFKFGNHTYLPF